MPTAAEQGLTGFNVVTWHAILAPAKVPVQDIARLNREFVRVLQLPDMQETLMAEGGEVTPTTPHEAASFIRDEVAKWGKALKSANITLE